MAGNVSPQAGPRGRYIPRGHALSWWMLVITTGAILITSIDRAILPTVLPGILKEFKLSETAGLWAMESGGLTRGAWLWS
jgi:hypothetical protein